MRVGSSWNTEAVKAGGPEGGGAQHHALKRNECQRERQVDRRTDKLMFGLETLEEELEVAEMKTTETTTKTKTTNQSFDRGL